MWGLVFWLLLVAGWVTHIAKCVTEWTVEYLIFLVVGVLFFPIGVVHGWLVWLSAIFG